MEHTLLFLLEITVKATTIVGATALACWLLRRASAAVRHFTWAIALAGVLALPALALLMPDWRVALLPAPPAAATIVSSREGIAPPGPAPDIARDGDSAIPLSENLRPGSRSTTPGRSQEPAIAPNSFIWSEPDASRSDRSMADREAPDRGNAARPISNSRQPITRTHDRRMIGLFLLTLWVTGMLIVLGRFLAGHVRLRWMERDADAITDPAWLELAQRVAEQLRGPASNGTEIRRLPAIRLLRYRRPTMPVCWGLRRPSLLLPSDADSWTVERRRIVLLHELAHAKRRDCLTQALAHMAIAMHWFNPLVWLAAGHLRAERERACDDLVLASGANAPDYADHLLDIARAFSTAGCPSWAAVAMARPSQLEGRLLAILDRHRDRRAPTRPACAGAAVVALAMVATLAAVEPAPASDAQASPRTASKGSAHPTQGNTPRPTTAAEPHPGGAEPVPVQSPRPKIAAEIDLHDPLELNDLEVDGLIRAGEGIGEGVGIGIGGGVLAGAPQIDLDEVERRTADAVLALDSTEIAAQAAGRRIAGILPADERPEADPKIVAALVTALKDQNADVRREAASTLADLQSPQALDALIAATTDADKAVREFAVRAISRHRSDAVTQALVRALKDSDPGVRRTAMLGVARLRDPKYMDLFVDALKSGDPEVRTLAIRALSGFRDARAVPALVTALTDANTEVRRYAAHALGQIGDARAVDPLVAALKDTDGEVREMVVYALGQIGRRADSRGRK